MTARVSPDIESLKHAFELFPRAASRAGHGRESSWSVVRIEEKSTKLVVQSSLGRFGEYITYH